MDEIVQFSRVRWLTMKGGGTLTADFGTDQGIQQKIKDKKGKDL